MTDQRIIILRAAGTALVLRVPDHGLPHVLHWGIDLPDIEGLASAATPPAAHNGVDVPTHVSLVPTQGEGWRGHPGLAGHHEGRVTYPAWTAVETIAEPLEGAETGLGGRVLVTAEGAGLRLRCELRMEAQGLVRARNTVTNLDPDPWTLDALNVTLPLPREAEETLDLTGRWVRERAPQRAPLNMGTRMRAARRGRGGHDAALVLTAGTPGFGFRTGEVWGVHTAWSGDHVHLAERLPEGAGQADAIIVGAELLHPGEVRLGPGESYSTPWVFLAWSDRGLDGLSGRFHRWSRARPEHPSSPRPVVLNTWKRSTSTTTLGA